MTAQDHHAHVEDEDKSSFVQAYSTPDTAKVHEIHDTPKIHTEDTTTYQQSDDSTFISHQHTSTEKPAGTFTDFGTANLTKVALPALFKAMRPKAGDVIQGARSYLPSRSQISELTGDAYSKASEAGRWTYDAGTDLGGKMYNDGYEIGLNAYNGTADWLSSATEHGKDYLASGSEKVSEMSSQLGQSDAGSTSRGVLSSVMSFAGDHPYALALAGTAALGTVLIWGRGGKKGKKGKTSVASTTLR